MNKKWFTLLLSSCLLQPVLIHAADPVAAVAQNPAQKSPAVKLSQSRKESIKALEARQIRLPLLQNGVPVFGILQYSKEGISWVAGQAAPVKLPHSLDTLVAPDGQAILQFGDESMLDNPFKMDLFFVNAQGQELAKVVDRYGAQTSIVQGQSGHVAVAGPLLGKEKQQEVGLYTASGEVVFQTNLDPARRAALAVPATDGKHVAAFTTDAKNYLAQHRLSIFDSSGKHVAQQTGVGILQKAVAVGEGAYFFIQAKNRFGLVRASDGTFLWSRDGMLRLVSPFGAATDPTGSVLFLAAAEWTGKPQAAYQWRIEVREVSTGNELARIQLPDNYPGSMQRVFLNVTDTQVEILAGNERIVLDWRQP